MKPVNPKKVKESILPEKKFDEFKSQSNEKRSLLKVHPTPKYASLIQSNENPSSALNDQKNISILNNIQATLKFQQHLSSKCDNTLLVASIDHISSPQKIESI